MEDYVMATFDKVKELLIEQLNLDEEKVTMEADIIEDLQADSLDIFEMLVIMEEEFNITLSDERAKQIKTVGDLVTFVEEVL